MLRAAHYKPEAVDSPGSKSSPKHRPGGVLDLALTAADKYALSLLPNGLKGTGLSGVDPAQPADPRGGQAVAPNGYPPSFKLQRGGGSQVFQSMPVQPVGGAAQQAPVDSRMINSWDSSFKEILAALEPDNRTLKPAKLRDIKYPNQNHGMPTAAASPPARRELDEALVTLPRGPRRGKGAIPSYTSPVKGFSRHGRRPEVQGVDVQYDLVPGVKLAWASPTSGAYHTAGYGGSPKKYTSQLVGRVSPHYSGTSASSQEPVHLPDITGHGYPQPASHALAYLQQQTPNRGSYSSPPQSLSPGHATRKALPYVSSTSPSLARPLTVQYNPVLKSPATSIGGAAVQPPEALPAAGWGSRMSPPHPGFDQNGSVSGQGLGSGTRSSPRGQNGTPPYRLPPGPPEIAVEIARMRSHDMESVGSSDAAQGYRPELPAKSKFLQMYEDPSRPVANIDTKQLLADVAPQQQQPGRKDSHVLTSSGSGSIAGRSPMYERRLKPLPSGVQGEGAGQQLQAGGATGDGPIAETSEAVSTAQPTPMSSVLEHEDTALDADLNAEESRLETEPCSPTAGASQSATESPTAAVASAEAVLAPGEQAPGAEVTTGPSVHGARNVAGTQSQMDQVTAEASSAVPSTDAGTGTGAVVAGAGAAPGDSCPSETVEQSVAASATERFAVAEGEAQPSVSASGEVAVQLVPPPHETASSTGEPASGSEPARQQSNAGAAASGSPRAGDPGLLPQHGIAPPTVPTPSSTVGLDAGRRSPALLVVTGPEGGPPPDGAPASSSSLPRTEALAAESRSRAAATAVPAGGGGASPSVAASSPEGVACTAGISSAPSAGQGLSLPAGHSPEEFHAAIVRIQSHARGYLARRYVAELRQGHEAGQAALAAAVSAAAKVNAYELPPGVTPEMAEAAAINIQTHARGYLARRQVARMRRGLQPALDGAQEGPPQEAAAPKFQLPPGVTSEMAEAAAIRVQAHMRGHLARRRVRQIRAAQAARVVVVNQPGREGEDADMALREAGEAVSMGLGLEDPSQAAAAAAAEPMDEEEEAAAAAAGMPAVEQSEAKDLKEDEAAQELTVDALKAALADDEEDDVAGAGDGPDAAAAAASGAEAVAAIDMSDPASVAAAAAAAAMKGASRIFSENVDPVADTTAAADQAAEAEANMARLAASSARTSAMFQGAGAEMRYSDDEASALELMDNLDGLLQGDDEAAAAAAAVAAAAAAAPADGELVCISPHGLSEPQALGTGAGGVAPNPMDVLEPGGVRVLAGKYEVQHVVGEGAYGMVMKCKVRATEPAQWVAIKEFKIDDNDPDAEDVKRTSLREVAVLEALQHPHVVRFVDKFMVGDRLFIVMEFLPCNLLELLEAQPGGMDRDAVRLIMFQLCSAIAFIHSKGMIYRDIKPENLLVDESGTVKLCDFGFARYLPGGPSSHLTDYVATRWYRAPELLLGPPFRDSTGKHVQYMYGPQVDMWAVGCLMGELIDGEPLFAGDSDLDQLYRVQQILGPMAASQQYLFYANPHNTGIVFNIKQPLTLGARYRGKVSEVELDFMAGLLEMDPDKRLTGEQCLQHPYLADLAAAAQALPTPAASMPVTPAPASATGYAQSLEGTAPPDPMAPPAPAVSSSAAGTPRGIGSESGQGAFQTPPSRGLEVAASLTRAAGSLARTTGSLSRTPGSVTRGGGSMTRGGGTPVRGRGSYSPLPLQLGPEVARVGSLVRAHESGEVVIVEGVVEEGMQAAESLVAVQSLGAVGEITAVAG